MITCGWCSTHYQHWQNRCDSCGGPMPPMPGMAIGAPPPPAPRSVPSGFPLRVLLTNNIASIIGAIIFGAGAFMTLMFLVAGNWGALFPGLFALGGFLVLRFGIKQGRSTLHAFRDGIAVEGKVHQVSKDTTTTVNGEHPWKLVYHFRVADHLHQGVLISFDSTLSKRVSGQPLWVLYVPENPEKNTLYPPVK
ncbi:hypothetical protein FEM03_15965 [Phragmitibacter flavus]|uniref:DUF3592 domain-containing protein n=1 Tax=Phragmitibacter flavus TaxID=2576071 RepID=A0A5R8KBY2_9BACT|nr:hypothetical protein [Phragmitibacter flavus]TLD69818.1 hypothetical protein FEM03_15965 [Phragmitibacter flavus]